MKKYIFLLVFAVSIFTAPVAGNALDAVIQTNLPMPPHPSLTPYPDFDCWNDPPGILRQGIKNDTVKHLQTILSQDNAVYPQGFVTGYFGAFTKQAVKKLQEKYGLPETGAVDNITRPIIFPCLEVRVASPNGGETFRVDEVMKIAYEITVPTYEVFKPNPDRPYDLLQLSSDSSEGSPGGKMIRPMPQVLSVDLIDAGQALIFHIRNISLGEKGDPGSFDWTIPQGIPESSSYKVRISSGKPYVWYVYDESDAPFSILGGQLPIPSSTPIPTPPDVSPTPIPSVTPIPITPFPTSTYIPQLQGIQVLSPNGGEAWEAGETYAISWIMREYIPVVGKPSFFERLKAIFTRKKDDPSPIPVWPLSIDLIKNGDTVLNIETIILRGNTGEAKWTIPSDISSSQEYKMRISIMPSRGYPLVFDESDGAFAIVEGTQ